MSTPSNASVLTALPAYLRTADGAPLSVIAGAKVLGVRVGRSVHPLERDLIRAALQQIAVTLQSTDPRVMAWWVAMWTAPLTTSTIRAIATDLGRGPRYFEHRRMAEGRPTFGVHLRLARVLRLQAIRHSGLQTKVVAALSGIGCAKALRMLMDGMSTKVTDYESQDVAIERYLRDAVRDASAWCDWMPFEGIAPLPSSALRPAYDRWARQPRYHRSQHEPWRDLRESLDASALAGAQ